MAYFGPAQRVCLSKDSRHVITEIERFRDYIHIAAVVAGASAVAFGHSVMTHNHWSSTVGSAMMSVSALWLIQHSKKNHDRLAQKVDQIAHLTGQDAPVKKRGLMHENDVGPMLKVAQQQAPDLMAQIINRRKRRWETEEPIGGTASALKKLT